MERFEFASQVTDEQVANNMKARAAFRAHLDGVLGHDGVIVLPTVPDVASLLSAPESELEVQRNLSMRLLCASGLSGCPQVTIPLLQKDGAPMGISLLGPRGSDKALCHLAADIYARLREQHA